MSSPLPISRWLLRLMAGILITFIVLALTCLLAGGGIASAEIAFDSARSGDSAIYVMDIERGITYRATYHPNAADTNPVWSPDGEQIAFVSTNGTAKAIYLLTIAGGEIRHLLDITTVGANSALAWSPDGKTIAYTALDGNVQAIFTISLDDGVVYRLPAIAGHAFSPSWSPDGHQIAFSWSPVANAEIWIISLSEDRVTNDPVKITANPLLDTAPAWSPDGEWIAFSSDRGGNSEIYLMRPDGSDLHPITSNPAIDTTPAWSPDGHYLVFASNRNKNQEIYVMAADGGQVRRLTHQPTDDSRPTWRP